jgi:hypothetical protein
MKKLALTLLVLTSAPAFAADSPLLKCRAIADNTARLACYDALVPAAVAAPVASAAAPVAVASTAAVAAPAPAVAAAKPEDSFGLSSMGKKSEPDVIDTHIPGAFDGWRPNMRINFANGQVWRVVDDSTSYVSGDDLKVKVVKGLFGNFTLEVEGSNRTASVKRVK